MAYDAVVELKQFIKDLQKDSISHIRKSKVEFISKELSFLGPFLKIMRLLQTNATLDMHLESRAKEAILELKDRIESELSESCTDCDDESSSLQLSQQLSKAKQEIGLLSETLKSDEEYKRREQESCSNFRSATSDFIGKKKMVGLHDHLARFKDKVLERLEGEYHRRIVVTGMTGIGKTAFVQEIFRDPMIVENFEAYLFLPFGPRFRFKEILRLALCQLGVESDKFQENISTEQLENHVKECLSGRRTLVVLDDLWYKTSALAELYYNILPDPELANCIIITTQNLDLVERGISVHIHVPFLNDEESWSLLRETVFTSKEEQCSRKLEKIGKKIAKKCEGLPMAIIQVGEILHKTNKTVEEWKIIAEKEDPLTITAEDNTPLSNGLSLSYNMLPECLKVCFLYIGVFPKTYKISHSKLIQLWVSEDFLQPIENESLEETGKLYLDELICRCCVLCMEVKSLSTRETKTSRLHFTFRSLCVSEAKREKVFHVVKKLADCSPENIDGQQRLCIHNSVVLGFKEIHETMELAPNVCSFLCYGPEQRYPIVLYLPFRLLKLLDVLSIRFYEFPDQVLDLIRLTYLAITCDGELPPSISRLQNLEDLIFRPHHHINESCVVSYLPIEIWKLSKLKHLHCMGFDLPDPSSLDDDSLILGSLLVLSGVSDHSCTSRVLARMPKLTKLGMRIDSVEATFSSLGDFTSLDHTFDSFKCIVMYPCTFLRSQAVASSTLINFPINVTKITLGGCGFPWEYMRVIEGLPNLKVLKLRCYAFCGPEWVVGETEENEEQWEHWEEPGETPFRKLEYLLLEDLDIQRCVAINGDFDQGFISLKHLIIRHCYELQEIPKKWIWVDHIELDYCSSSLLKHIQDRRWSFEDCLLEISSAWDDDKK